MIVAFIRTRLRPGVAERYDELVAELAEIASSMPGFISVKGPYRNEEGEEFSVHEWESAEHLRAWSELPEHLKVQALGREVFYEEFTIYVCDNLRITRFKRPPSGKPVSQNSKLEHCRRWVRARHSDD